MKLVISSICLFIFICSDSSILAATDSQANLAQQANNPIANMISVPFQFQSAGTAYAGLKPVSPTGTVWMFGRTAVRNADGSVDIYFGPEAPEGKESNWIQTVPGRGWFAMFRLYSPLQPWIDQSWRPGEIELVK